MSAVDALTLRSRVFTSMYRDSVSLMVLASQLQRLPGIDRAGVVMATPANLDILEAAGMLPPAVAAAPDDLLVVVRAADPADLDTALEHAAAHVSTQDAPEDSTAAREPAATVAEGLQRMPDANLLAVSTPGACAPLLVRQGLTAGLHVFCFSDNIPLADEVALKELAIERGLLLMGPDCGTSLIDGVPLGFVNVVAQGPVGIVSASGTGAQEVMCQLDALGVGVSQVIGVGGRDLSTQVGGRMTMHALDLLAADEETACIVVVGKPPAPEVAAALRARVGTLATPVVLCLIGADEQPPTANAIIAVTLADAAAYAARVVGVDLAPSLPAEPTILPEGRAAGLLGLFAGGTLAAEAEHLLREYEVDAEVLDLGDDEYTVGRPHPMIDPSLRVARVLAAGADADVRVLLLDVVLGHGASDDPAGPLAEAVAAARARAAQDGRVLTAVASVCGTRGDPQGLERSQQVLIDAGVIVAGSNAAAASIAAQLVKAGA